MVYNVRYSVYTIIYRCTYGDNHHPLPEASLLIDSPLQRRLLGACHLAGS